MNDVDVVQNNQKKSKKSNKTKDVYTPRVSSLLVSSSQGIKSKQQGTGVHKKGKKKPKDEIWIFYYITII